MSSLLRAILVLAALAAPVGHSSAQSALPTSGTTPLSIKAGGAERTYVAHVPDSAPDREAALVIVLHGAGGSGQIAIEQGRWLRASARHGFIVLAPDGSLQYPRRRASLLSNPRTWNAGPASGNWASDTGIDDTGLIRDLIDLWVDAGRADPGRVYVTGFSNGAAMAFRAGAELPDRIAAIAPVSNGLLVSPPKMRRPVSLILIWGEDDPLNPIAGGEVSRGGSTVTRPSGEASWRRWGARLGCSGTARQTISGEVTLLSQTGCAGGSEALFYRIDGLGHQWPGGRAYVPMVSGSGSDAIGATEVIWQFFTRHARGW